MCECVCVSVYVGTALTNPVSVSCTLARHKVTAIVNIGTMSR